MTYHFEFDAAGRPTNVKVGSQLLSKTTYNADGTVKQVDYGNEDSIQYTYDAFKRLTGVRGRWDAEDRYVYEYGANGQVARLTNDELSTVSTSEYDAANRPMRITQKNSVSDVHLYTGEVTYDQYNNLASFKEQVGADRAAYTTTFTHDNENRPTQLDFGSSCQVAYTYDGLGRVSKRTVNAGGTAVETNYGYLAGGHGTGSTTPLVQTISQNGMTLTYTYDDAGNITSVSDGSKTVSYVYDLLGQLIRANDPYDTTAGDSGTTWVYSYDQGGNILSRAAYAFTTDAVGTAMQTNRYVYDDANWKDKLTTYNGKTIPYDAIGNPLSDGNWNLTWVDGRRLRSMYKGEVGQPGYDEITFEYNENGLRTKKNRMFYDSATGTVRQQTTEYTLHGKNIVHWSSGTNTMHFFYDAQNKPAVVVHNGKPYGYLYNLQGDVIALIDSSGNRVVEYRYDAWGRILSKTGTMADSLGTINPFRYRGYVYDGETGLYYLRSRYYKPNWARFLNADALLNKRHLPLSSNLFAYCKSNSTNKVDTDGYGDIYVFYYHWDGSKSSLENQAQNAPYYNWEEVKGIEVASSADFINAWNAMDDTDVDDVYIFLHGGPGILNMDHDIISSDGEYSFDQLEYKKVQNAVFLFSCYGATVDANNNSVALQLMEHTSAPKLYACEVGVSFSKIIDRGSARVTWKHYLDGVPYWAKFIRRGNMIIKQMLDTLILRKE